MSDKKAKKAAKRGPKKQKNTKLVAPPSQTVQKPPPPEAKDHLVQMSPDKNQIVIDLPMGLPPGTHKVNCPLCGAPTQMHVPASSNKEPGAPQAEIKKLNEIKQSLPELSPEHPVVIKERMHQRQGKKTLVMLGTHPQSLALMPWGEGGIDEIWGLNDGMSLPVMQAHEDQFTRWFQMHHRWRFTRRQTRYGDDHWDWLQQDHGDMQIYMQRHYADVPNSVKFPLREVCEELIGGLLPRGAGYVRQYFTNTFAYAIGLALLEKKHGINDWERIEIYGCELLQTESEYFRQRPGIEWWLGLAAGHGIEVYVPAHTRILYAQKLTQQQQLAQYPGYMAYGYASPSLEEAKRENLPWGEDPTEENLIGAWEDYEYPSFESNFYKGVHVMDRAASVPGIKTEAEYIWGLEELIPELANPEA
jgi:hypothetical protein